MRVAICIGTFHREDLLRELLESLTRLTFRHCRPPAIEVIVVDNDPNGSAREVCANAERNLWLRYVVEPRRGIAHVRNRAALEAAQCDLIAFVDDDEVVSPQWLDELLWVRLNYALDIVTGPVRPTFVGEIPTWVKTSECFNRTEFPTGTLLDKCSTSNALISAAVFKALSGFDEKFQLTGGEDTHFSMRAHRAGFRIGWSQRAVAYEAISRQRANLRWILHRGFQNGNSWVLSESLLQQGRSFRLVRLCKATVHLLGGLAASLASVFVSRGLAVKHLRQMSMGAGMLFALIGHEYQAYSADLTPVNK